MRIGTRVVTSTWDEQAGESILGTALGTVVGGNHDENDEGYASIVKVRWDNGVLSEHGVGDIEDVTPRLYVNVYLHDRAYGGPEEGGWWYDTYDPELEQCKVFATPEEAEAYVDTAQAWCNEENSCRRSDISSVISEGRYDVRLEAWPPEYHPTNRPYYC